MKRGFTLIELLAVIVILAIIALIAVPIVINIINDSKKESQQRSIDLYMDTVQKRITQENMKVKYEPERCDIQDNGNVKCYSKEEIIKTSIGEEELKIEMNGKKPESGTIIIENNKATYSGVVLEGMEYTTGKQPKEYVPSMSATDEDYRGYYADVDGDGEPDGIIYADLGANIEYPQSGNWHSGILGQYEGKYTYDKATGELNEYTTSNNTYKKNEGFGENKIIKLKKNKNNPRFYVIALENFTTTDYTTFYWYKNAYKKMKGSDTSSYFGKGYENTGKMIGIWEKNGEGEGSYQGATQDGRDIWKHIKDKYNSKEKWYIPSRGEWAAFADYFTNKTDLETKLTTSNYEDFGLSSWYWSSSQWDARHAWDVRLRHGYVDGSRVSDDYSIRLGATF